MTTSPDTAARSAATPGTGEGRTTFVWGTLAPALFVLLWATGFIGAKAGLPYAEPFTFVAVRYAVVVALMLPSSIDYAVCYAALARLGAVTTGLNTRLGPREVAAVLDRAGPVLVIRDDAAGLPPVPDAPAPR